MFQQCLDNGIMPFIVLDSKAFYYRGLSEYEQETGIPCERPSDPSRTTTIASPDSLR